MTKGLLEAIILYGNVIFYIKDTWLCINCLRAGVHDNGNCKSMEFMLTSRDRYVLAVMIMVLKIQGLIQGLPKNISLPLTLSDRTTSIEWKPNFMKVTKSSTIFIWEGAHKNHVRAESEVGSSAPLRALEAVGYLMFSLSRAIWTLFKHSDTKWDKTKDSRSFFSSIVDQILGRKAPVAPPPPLWIRHCSDQLLSIALSCINSFSYFTMCTPSANVEGSRPWLVLHMRNCFCCFCFKIVDYQTKSNVFFTKCWKIIEVCMCFYSKCVFMMITQEVSITQS